MISIKIAKQKSKDQILEDYLNTIYYGRGAYGIQTAAKAYFGKDVSQAHRLPGCPARLGHPRALVLRPGPGHQQQAQNAEGALDLRHGRHGVQGWMTAGRARAADVPQGRQVPSQTRAASGPNGYIINAGQGRAARASSS